MENQPHINTTTYLSPTQIECLFREQAHENQTIAHENQELRSKIAELEEQLIDEQTRSTRLYTEHQFFVQWTRKLLANSTIPESTKLVLWQYYYTFSQMHDKPEEQEMRISVEDTAAAVGLSTSTVRKATDKAEMFDVLSRRYEKVESGSEKHTQMYITLDPIVSTPQDIKMEKYHGGKRTPVCHKCGSEDVDRYTVQYCRNCDKNEWYGQPGLRADANVMLAKNAQNSEVEETGKKQDAFTSITTIAPIEETEETEETDQPGLTTQTQEDAQQATPRETGKKQDAFTAIASYPISEMQVAAEEPDQLAAEHSIYITAASCDVTDPVCRFCGPIQKWMWSPSDQKRICPHCYSPQQT